MSYELSGARVVPTCQLGPAELMTYSHTDPLNPLIRALVNMPSDLVDAMRETVFSVLDVRAMLKKEHNS